MLCVKRLFLLSAGPRKPSEDTDLSLLQPTSSSLSLPKGLLQRHALSLGSSLGSSPTRGFGRKSAAGGILDHLQMPIRPGLKFPSRDFGRASKALPSAPLSPKPSLPKPAASNPRSASPIPPPAHPPTPAAAPEPALEAAAEVFVEAAPEGAPESVGTAMPEPKRPLRSRFTEEYLSPVMHSLRAAPVRPDPAKQPDQAPLATQPKPSSAVETQTSTVAGQTEADPNMHGFRRHMSLRDPPMGVAQVYAHPRLGRPTADDVITTAQPCLVQPQRRATTDFMLEPVEEAEPSSISDEQASAPAKQPSPAEGDSQEVHESDFVEDLVKTLSSGGADDSEDPRVMLDLDSEVAGLMGPAGVDPADPVMLDSDTDKDGVVSSAQVQEAAALRLSAPNEEEGPQPSEMAVDVDAALQRVATDVEQHAATAAAAAVDDAVVSLGQEAEVHFHQGQSAAIDSSLQSLTTAVVTAESARQSEAVDTAVTNLTARVTHEHDEQAAGEVECAVMSLTQQAEAADEADQAAAVTTVVASLRVQSADHYERSDSLAVSAALGGVQSEAETHFQTQTLATVDEALGGLVGDTLEASDAEQAAAVGEALSWFPPPAQKPPLHRPVRLFAVFVSWLVWQDRETATVRRCI